MGKLKLLVSFVLILNPIFASATAITCLATFSSVEAFIDCLDKHTVPEGFYTTLEAYTAAQPSGPTERNAWSYSINSMLSIGCPSGPPIAIPGLNGDYVMARVSDSTRFGKTWCVLVEARTISDTSLVFKRGWGFVITPHPLVSPAARRLHFSAPHPQTDANTPRQAGALFDRTGAKSLVVTGRHRRAFTTVTSCSVALSPDIYYKTDSSHDNNEPFYLAVSEVASWQDARGGCPWDSCAYIQMHGKSDDPADPTCPEYDIFMSSGLGNTDTSEACYTNTLLPITRLKAKLVDTFRDYDIGTPTELGTCKLTATRNIFMRRVSGIDATDVCVDGNEVTRVIPCACTASRGCMGKFVHIEQDSNSRHRDNYGKWADAFKAVFPPSTPLRDTDEGLEANIFKVQS